MPLSLEFAVSHDMLWFPSVELSAREEKMVARLRGKHGFFVFLRMFRHELLDEHFQLELVDMYRQTGAGKPPHLPGRMALLTLLQVYTKCADHEAVERTLEPRWQMVLDWFGEDEPPVSQATLFDFRMRLQSSGMDKRLLEKSVELARRTGGFSDRSLRAAVDSSPLVSRGRVEDTFNLLAHAARQVLHCIGRLTGHTAAEVVEAAELNLIGGPRSVKALLDVDWNKPDARNEALERLLSEIVSLETWILEHIPTMREQPPLREAIETLERLMRQDLEPDPEGGTRIAQRVAADRQISVTEPSARHGRKSKSKSFNGYKRHILMDLDEGLVLSTVALPANAPEHVALAPLVQDAEDQHRQLVSLHIDRGYLSAPKVAELDAAGVHIVCRPWPNRRRGLFSKADFTINVTAGTVTCPTGEVARLRLGKPTRFKSTTCAVCPLKIRCTPATTGRVIQIHEREELHQKLIPFPTTQEGRDALRERTAVEHSLAHVGQRQGNQARYTGTEKNAYHLRMAAAVTNLQTAARFALTERRAA